MTPLCTKLDLKTNIGNAFIKLSPEESLLRISIVALLKIATLCFYIADLLFLENLGYIVWKEPVIVPIVKENISTAIGDIMVMTAIKDLWATTMTLVAVIKDENMF